MAAQRTTLCDRLIELCDAEPGATNMNTMRALHDALATMHERMEISEAKATGGTTRDVGGGSLWLGVGEDETYRPRRTRREGASV